MGTTVFAFDIGTGSLGFAVRKNDEIIEARSLLLPPKFASTEEERSRRRQYRTRIAHNAREKWLREQCRAAGIEVLEGRRPENRKKGIPARAGDPRLEREFASPETLEKTVHGDYSNVYTSCLLRILLLRGEKLESWQIFKALHSAIQRRGYDPKVPWKRGTDSAPDDEKENQENAGKFEIELHRIAKGRGELMYPCYYDAFRIGLWNPETNQLTFRPYCTAERARGYTSPRILVEKELRALLKAAAKQYPALAGQSERILYGPAEKAYASCYPHMREKHNLKEGGETDWKGALAQKIPRFNNRVADKCALIPRYNVCRASDILAIQVTFLMKLMNLRYFDGYRRERQLSPEDIRGIFAGKADEVLKLDSVSIPREKLPEKIAAKYKFTPTAWKKWLEKHNNGEPLSNHEAVDAPKITGRTRFCRPALRLLKELILSGESPWKFYSDRLESLVNEDPKKGLVTRDLEFLLAMPHDWRKIHIPAMSLADKFRDETGESAAAIRALTGKQNNPVIRHRMEVFSRYIQGLAMRHGIPDRVVIEFVREDFMGPKKKAEYEKIQRENRKRREDARTAAEELGYTSRTDVEKLMLLKQQGYRCIYTGQDLSRADLSTLDIDHIVPRRGKYNGSDSIHNRLVTTAEINRIEKRDCTPYEFLSEQGGWGAYCERVKACATTLGRKKARLLTAEHPEELDEQYMSLAETAWLARLARDIVCLTFGWQPGAKNEAQRVFIVSGGLTAVARAKYNLNPLLGSEDEKKNRDDKRHHALDAMVLSFIAHNDPTFPEHIHKEHFRTWIERVIPEPIALEKPALEQTIYAARTINNGKKSTQVAVKRVPLADLIKPKDARTILDPTIRKQVLAFLENDPDKQAWAEFVANFRQAENRGSRVVKVAVTIGELDEYINLSKNDGRGQYRRGAKHQGQYVYRDTTGRARVRPVYVFESRRKVKEELISQGFAIADFFTAGCLVEIENPFIFSGRHIPAGKYQLGSLWTDGRAKIKSSLSAFEIPISIVSLLKAGFHRVRSE